MFAIVSFLVFRVIILTIKMNASINVLFHVSIAIGQEGGVAPLIVLARSDAVVIDFSFGIFSMLKMESFRYVVFLHQIVFKVGERYWKCLIVKYMGGLFMQNKGLKGLAFLSAFSHLGHLA